MDRDFNHDVVRGLRQREPAIDIVCVGDPDAPDEQSTDPELLEFAWQQQRMFVTRDKRTMPEHLTARFAAGGHTMGVAILRPRQTVARFIDELLVIWAASSPDEWYDVTVYLPN
jgi:hypothetical protein